ncbi:TPA: hypothetical protein G8M32_004775 [Salmonella enterica]|nr:hypothetical protein [Salmonella enterica]
MRYTRKPRLFAAIGVFAFISFVNQKSADFVLSAPVAPCHFLGDYSAFQELLIPHQRDSTDIAFL